MERLLKKDAEEGIESRPCTDAQKAAIAEVRNFYEAKLAEQQVLYQSALRNTADPAGARDDRGAVSARPRAFQSRARFEDRQDRRAP